MTHRDRDRCIGVESGHGEAILDGVRHLLHSGIAVVVAAGTAHTVINTSSTEPLRLDTIYSPEAQADGTINRTRQDAVAYKR